MASSLLEANLMAWVPTQLYFRNPNHQDYDCSCSQATVLSRVSRWFKTVVHDIFAGENLVISPSATIEEPVLLNSGYIRMPTNNLPSTWGLGVLWTLSSPSSARAICVPAIAHIPYGHCSIQTSSSLNNMWYGSLCPRILKGTWLSGIATTPLLCNPNLPCPDEVHFCLSGFRIRPSKWWFKFAISFCTLTPTSCVFGSDKTVLKELGRSTVVPP